MHQKLLHKSFQNLQIIPYKLVYDLYEIRFMAPITLSKETKQSESDPRFDRN
jgi:hypothetical protein